MRLTILPFAVAIATLAGGIGAAPAQSPNSYPWCARVVTKAASTSCYYATKELCMLTISGVGGYCYENPGYQGRAAGAARPAHKQRPGRPS
jgi:Protein of unknown function (DUF3551)